MSQKIATLENKVVSLERGKKRAELEKQRAEMKAESYRKQLIKLGFDPDTIQ